MQFRIRVDNLPKGSLGGTFVRVSSNADGLTLDGVKLADMPLKKHRGTGVLARAATVITDITRDPDDEAYVLVTTLEVMVPDGEKFGGDSTWKSV